MLTRLAIKNFKSIGDPGVDLELRPLTFLVGPNGSGKSSVLEALALLAQSRGPDPLADLPMRGELVKYAGSEEIIYKKEIARRMTLRLNRRTEEQEGSALSGRILATSQNLPSAVEEVGFEYQFVAVPSERRFSTQSFRVLIDSEVLSPDLSSQVGHDTPVFKSVTYFVRAGRGVQAGPVQGSTEPSSWVGPLGEKVVDVLNWLNSGEHRSKKHLVELWAEKFGIKGPSGYAIAGSLDANYDDPVIGANVPLRVASYGSLQVLTLVVQVFVSEPSSLIMIEEPEISLHPEAQVAMAELLATAAAEGKQVLATTHSTFLLLGLTSAVQKGIIKPQDVVVYELEKDAQGTKVKRKLELNKKGVIKGWVDSFSEVEKKLLRDWTATLPKV